MILKTTKDYEIHYLWDIPSIMVKTVEMLLNKDSNKTYLIMFGNPLKLEGKVKITIEEEKE